MKEKNKITEIGFTGSVEPAPCECHKGFFATVVWLIRPQDGTPVFCSDALWSTEAEAEKELDGFVMHTADKVLKAMGLSMDAAKQIKIARGDDAVKMDRNLRAALNPNLH